MMDWEMFGFKPKKFSEFETENGALKKYNGSDETVRIPDGITELSEGCLSLNASVKHVIIPDGVAVIGGMVFWGMIGLESITVDENNPNYRSVDGNLYTKDGRTLICYAVGKKDTVFRIPDGVETVCNFACCYAGSLSEVIIPDTVTEIGIEVFNYCKNLTALRLPKSVRVIGEDTFFGCAMLSGIEVSEDNPAYRSVNGDLYTKDGTVLLRHFGGEGEDSFTVPNGVRRISGGAFYGCDKLGSVILPEGLEFIGDRAFRGCDSLRAVNIPDSVTGIGERAFSHCRRLGGIHLPDGLREIGKNAFEECGFIGGIRIPRGVTVIADGLFAVCTSLTEVTVPDSVTYIGDGAFFECAAIKEMVIPDSVTYMGKRVFSHCRSLERAVLSRNAKCIGDLAFTECKMLESIIIPEGIERIEEEAFRSCERLRTVSLPSSLKAICRGAFSRCLALVETVIPDGIKKISPDAFKECSSIETVHMSAEKLRYFLEVDETFPSGMPEYAVREQTEGLYAEGKKEIVLGLRGCLLRYARGELSAEETAIVDGYMPEYAECLIGEIKRFNRFALYFTDRKLLTAEKARELLRDREFTDTESRGHLLEYVRDNGGCAEIDLKYTLE